MQPKLPRLIIGLQGVVLVAVSTHSRLANAAVAETSREASPAGAAAAASQSAALPGASPDVLKEMDLSLALQEALKTHPDIELAREKLSESESNKSKAYSQAFPKLNSSVLVSTKQDALNAQGTQFNGSAYNYYSLGLDLSQPIYTGGALSSGIDLYDKDIVVKQYELIEAERDLQIKTMQAFYSVLLAEKQLAIQKKLETIQKELLRTAQSRYRIGNEQMLTVLQIKTTLSLLEPQVIAAENTLRVRAAELASLTGNPEITKLKLNGSLVAPDWDIVTKKVAKPSYERVELQRNSALTAQLEATKSLKLSVHMPTLYGVGTWGRTGTKKSALFDNDSSAWMLGLKLSIPLFSGLESVYDRRIQSSAVAQNRIAEKKLRDQFSLEQVKAEQDLANARNQVISSEKARTQAREAVDVANRTYKLGTATYLQVSDTQQKLANAELSFEQAQYELIAKMTNYFTTFAWPMEPLVRALEEKRVAVAKAEADAALDSSQKKRKLKK